MADDDTKKPDDADDEKPGFAEEDEEPKTAVETVEAKKAQRESSPSNPKLEKATPEKATEPDDEDEDEPRKAAEPDDEEDEDEDEDEEDEDEDEVVAKPSPARSEPPAPKPKPKPHADHGAHDDHGFGHLVGVPLLGGILLVLLVLTVATVVASKVDLGAQLNLIVALIIATIKAGLVVTFFMHLLWDKKFNTLVFLSSIFFMTLFLSFAMTDRREYQHLIEQRETSQAALK